jgi:hypothetical protein
MLRVVAAGYCSLYDAQTKHSLIEIVQLNLMMDEAKQIGQNASSQRA